MASVRRVAALSCQSLTLSLTLWIGGCASSGTVTGALVATSTYSRLERLLPADALLLGEQHDAPDHQRIHREVIEALAARGALAAVVIEMAEQGTSTAGLLPGANEAAVRQALKWSDQAWPWPAYGPAVMAAVRAGVPVLGGNLPLARLRESMADAALDARLSVAALQAQQQAIRLGHCNALPESQIAPMARMQIARDLAMARRILQAAAPGKTVLLLAGSGHVDRQLGVPVHLPQGFKVRAIELRAARDQDASGASVNYDASWSTPAVPEKDYCADFRRPASAPTPTPSPVPAPAAR